VLEWRAAQENLPHNAINVFLLNAILMLNPVPQALKIKVLAVLDVALLVTNRGHAHIQTLIQTNRNFKRFIISAVMITFELIHFP
jgi:hypothetical protein